MSLRRQILVAVAALAICGSAHAQERSKGLIVNGEQKLPGHEITMELKTRTGASGAMDSRVVCEDCGTKSLTLPPTALAYGTDVAVCFTSNADGYVTLWSIDSKGTFALIYPNRFSHPAKTRAAQVTAGTKTCVGDDTKFRLTTSPPEGRSQLYIHWTKTMDDALSMDTYPVIGKSEEPSPNYTAARLQYEIQKK